MAKPTAPTHHRDGPKCWGIVDLKNFGDTVDGWKDGWIDRPKCERPQTGTKSTTAEGATHVDNLGEEKGRDGNLLSISCHACLGFRGNHPTPVQVDARRGHGRCRSD